MLSVIVPVCNGAHFLPESLSALRASELDGTRWELIVVDDSSRDQSAEVAARYADRVIRLVDGASGPAVARNRGADVARGCALVFVDADVCVHPDALGRMVDIFERQPDVAAIFGAYDLEPAAGGLVSQYRNLLHRYVHQRDAGDVITFWTGCGAVRTEVFVSSGKFDEEEALEDIELGYRMSTLGYRIQLRPEIQGRHLKRWTLRNMVITDVRNRGIPWVRLLMSGRGLPQATLNIRTSEQACTVLVFLGWLGLLAWMWSGTVTCLALSAAAVAATLAINGPLLAWFARQRGWWFALRILPLRLLYYTLNSISVSLAVLPFGFGRRRTSPAMNHRQSEA